MAFLYSQATSAKSTTTAAAAKRKVHETRKRIAMFAVGRQNVVSQRETCKK